MRGRRGGDITVAMIAEHVAFEAGKTSDQVLRSRRQYDIWLRHVVIWLARNVARSTVAEIASAIAKGEWVTTNHAHRAARLHAEDAEFREMTDIVAGALTAVAA